MKVYVTRMSQERCLITKFPPRFEVVAGTDKIMPYAIEGDPLNTQECYDMMQVALGEQEVLEQQRAVLSFTKIGEPIPFNKEIMMPRRRRKKSDVYLELDLKDTRRFTKLDITVQVEFDDDEQDANENRNRPRRRFRVDKNRHHETFMGVEDWYRDEIKKFHQRIKEEVTNGENVLEVEDAKDEEVSVFYGSWVSLLAEFQMSIAERMKQEDQED